MDYSRLSSYIANENQSVVPDSLSIEEMDALEDKKRGEALKKSVHYVAIVGVFLISLIMYTLLFIRVWHVAATCRLRWLNEEDLHNIERALFSGLILSFAGKYFKKYKIVDE